MTYAVLQNLIDRFGEQEILDLADRDADGVVDQVVVDSALADADQTINSYIGTRYDLPLASVPAVLVSTAADIARYRLFVQDATEAAETNYKAAIAFLRDVSKGAAVLDAAGTQPARDPSNVQIESSTKLFGREKMEGF